MTGSQKHFGVVVGVDGSGYSDVAVRWAAREATMRKVRLTLVQAVALPAPGWPALNVRELYETDAEAILDDAVTIVEDFMKGDGPSDLERQLFFLGLQWHSSTYRKTRTWWSLGLAGRAPYVVCCWDRSAPP